MPHKHQWKEIAKTYAPPISVKGDFPDSDLLEKAFFGITTILWECQDCQKLRKEELLGKEVEE